ELSPLFRTVLTRDRSLPTPFFSLPLPLSVGSAGAAELIFAVVGVEAIELEVCLGRARGQRGRSSAGGIGCGESVDAFTGYQTKTDDRKLTKQSGIGVGWGTSKQRRNVSTTI